MKNKAIKISKAIKNTDIANKINVRRYLDIALEHAQYYAFSGSHHGVGSSSACAIEDLIEQLSNQSDVQESILIALENVLTEERDEPALIGYRVYQKDLGQRVDIEIEALEGRREIRSAAREPERDSDGCLDCVVLDGDFLPQDCQVLTDEFADAYNNTEHYFYASIDLDALKQHVMEIAAEEAGINSDDLYAVINWLACDMIVDSISIDTDGDAVEQSCDITGERGPCFSGSVQYKDGRVERFWAIEDLAVGALAWLAGYY